MAGGSINEELDDLDSAMLGDFNEYVQVVRDAWEGFDGNPGQMVIVETKILPTVYAHIDGAMDRWPWGEGPEDYESAVYSCFDADVIDRAFSETINDTMDSMTALQGEASDLQHEHEYVIGLIGGSAEPHSTEAGWRD